MKKMLGRQSVHCALQREQEQWSLTENKLRYLSSLLLNYCVLVALINVTLLQLLAISVGPKEAKGKKGP